MVKNWKENQDYQFDNAEEWKGIPFLAPQPKIGAGSKPEPAPLTKEQKKANRQAVFGSLLSKGTDIVGSILSTKQAKESTKQAVEATKQAQFFSQGTLGNVSQNEEKDNTLPIVIGVVGFIAVAATVFIIIKNKK